MSTNNTRKPYIVVFGPQNVGKSTLVGYLYTKNWSQEQFELEEEKIKKTIGSNYDPRSRLALFVDTAKDEYIKTYSDGTSKHIHIKQVGNFIWIDTPGASTQRKERYKGVFLGEMGVFLIELEKIVDLLNNKDIDYPSILNLFGSLFVWQKLKADSDYLIGLTKIDNNEYSTDDIIRAINFVKDQVGNKHLKSIIPISIDIENRVDVGITSPSDFCSESLLEAISGFDNTTKNVDCNKLFLVNDKKFSNVQGYGIIYRWKVNSGLLRQNDRVKISPVIINNKSIETVTAEVRSLQNINKEAVEEVNSGEVVGVYFSKYKDKTNRTITRDNIEILKTTIVTDVNSNSLSGDIIDLDVDISECSSLERDKLLNAKIRSQVWIAWFGRMISTELRYNNGANETNFTHIQLQSQSSKAFFSLPIADDMFFTTRCVIQLRIKDSEDAYPVFITYKAFVKSISNSKILCERIIK